MLLRVLALTGRVLLAAGVLVLLFSAYQLWGTGLTEAHSQSTLRAKLAHELPTGALTKAAKVAAGTLRNDHVQSTPPKVADTTPPPAPGQPIGTIDIPSIGLSQVVVEGVTASDLRQGPGHYPGTALPGQAGNAAIAGHRTTYAHPFYNLTAATTGARIIITTPQGIFVYVTHSQSVVAPSDVGVLAASQANTLTLTTCNPRYSAATRLVLHATLQSSTLFGSPVATVPDSITPPTSSTVHAGLAGDGSSTGWVAALLLGLLVVAVAVATIFIARRVRHRWVVYIPGIVVMLIVLFVFFGAISPLLPASF